jgi:hypothetical protein
MIELPRPNEKELTKYNKHLYFERMFEIDYQSKYKMSQTQFSKWVHVNYDSVYLFNKSINTNQLKKIG